MSLPEPTSERPLAKKELFFINISVAAQEEK